jgi:hypothetical protein
MSPAATIVGPPPNAPLVGGISLDSEGGFSISPANHTGQMLVGEILDQGVGAQGTLVTIADGLSFSGVLSLKVAGPAGGKVTIVDGNGKTWLAASSPGTNVAVQRVTQVVQIPAGGADNVLEVVVSGGAVCLDAIAAGYTTIVN